MLSQVNNTKTFAQLTGSQRLSGKTQGGDRSVYSNNTCMHLLTADSMKPSRNIIFNVSIVCNHLCLPVNTVWATVLYICMLVLFIMLCCESGFHRYMYTCAYVTCKSSWKCWILCRMNIYTSGSHLMNLMHYSCGCRYDFYLNGLFVRFLYKQ